MRHKYLALLIITTLLLVVSIEAMLVLSGDAQTVARMVTFGLAGSIAILAHKMRG